MKRAVVLLASLVLSGCCCGVPGPASEETWARAVAREKEFPTAPLVAGTANVFELQVSLPAGLTQQQYAQFEDVSIRREVARLELRLAEETKDTASLAGLRAKLEAVEKESLPELGPLQATETIRVVMVHPFDRQWDEFGFSSEVCWPCQEAAKRNKALFMRSAGSVPVTLKYVKAGELERGVKVRGEVSLSSVAGTESASVFIPLAGEGELRLVESCPAEVVRVTQKLQTGTGSGVISVPTMEERSWYELRNASCVGAGELVRRQVRPSPITPSRHGDFYRLQRLKEQLGLK